MKFVMTLKQTLWLALALFTLGQGNLTAQDAPKTAPGLMVTYTADGVSDTTTAQNAWLYTESGKPVTLPLENDPPLEARKRKTGK